MQYFGGIQVINKYGYAKIFDVQKAIILIGNGPSNDIVLSADQGAGVEPVHLQVIFPQQGFQRCKVINLAAKNAQVVSGPSNGLVLKSHSMNELMHDDCISLGDFSLTLKIWKNRSITVEERSPSLGLKLQLPGAELQQGKNIGGLLTLTNYGKASRCQFKIEVDGIKKDCFQLGPAPFLFAGASEELPIQFIHQGNHPLAGRQVVTISATASQTYPTEVVELQFELIVEPVYQFLLEVEDLQPLHVAESLPSQPAKPASTPAAVETLPMPALVVAAIKPEPLAAQAPAKSIITPPAVEPAWQPTPITASSLPVKAEQPAALAPVPAAVISRPADDPLQQIVAALSQLASDPQEMQVSTVTVPAIPQLEEDWSPQPEPAVDVLAQQPAEEAPAQQAELIFSEPPPLPEKPAELTPAPAAAQPAMETRAQPAAKVLEEQPVPETVATQPTHLEALPAALVKNPDAKVRILRAPDSLAGETNNLEDIPAGAEVTPAPNTQKYGSFTTAGKPIKVVKAGSSLDDEPQASNGTRAGSKK